MIKNGMESIYHDVYSKICTLTQSFEISKEKFPMARDKSRLAQFGHLTQFEHWLAHPGPTRGEDEIFSAQDSWDCTGSTTKWCSYGLRPLKIRPIQN